MNGQETNDLPAAYVPPRSLDVQAHLASFLETKTGFLLWSASARLSLGRASTLVKRPAPMLSTMRE